MLQQNFSKYTSLNHFQYFASTKNIQFATFFNEIPAFEAIEAKKHVTLDDKNAVIDPRKFECFTI